MCGIAGVISSKQKVDKFLLKVQKIQQHRGPDAQGTCQHQINQWCVGLGFQRLAILDLTEAGNQPMSSPQQKSWLVYNGEVYNYKELRCELEQLGHQFSSQSDTEVVLTALEYWGPERALAKFNGMWALAWLDLRHKRLVLSRDRVGIKPLHFYLKDNEFYFASELKTILQMTNHKFSLNYQVVGEYLVQSLLAASNDTFLEGIQRIPAATYAVVNLCSKTLKLEVKSYWNLEEKQTICNLKTNLIEQIRELFIDAVRLRLRSDVPVGVLLSGGIDSSAIASVMQHILGKEADLKILSVVSKDSRYDESPFIDQMSDYLNCPIRKVLLDFAPEQAFAYLEQACWFNDEPVGSFSTVAHYLLMQQAKELGVTVILSGQGADELLCGYKKYLGFYVQSLLQQRHYFKAGEVLWSFWQQETILNQFSLAEAKRYLPHYWQKSELDLRGANLSNLMPRFVGLLPGMTVQQRQILDLETYSVPALVHYEDRMSMAWSREIRVPFLDYRLIETLIPLSPKLKLHNGWTKYIFRKAMEPYLPQTIAWRKDKQGFINPESEWLKNELKPGVLDYFREDSLIFKNQLVNHKNLHKKYKVYCQQKAGEGRIWFKDIFNCLALEVWLRKFESYIL
jgi:asparagine synthase (glutamine-hydrolysing)